jgi:hypothetical protein
MNEYAEQSVKARLVRRGGGNTKTPPPSDSASPKFPLLEYQHTSVSPTKLVQIAPSAIKPHMKTNWYDVAIPRFFSDYIWPSHKVPGGSLNFLPDVLKRSPECRFLKSALQAVGLISLANQQKQPHLLRDAEYCFLHAIAGVAKALEDTNQAKSDAVIATTFLFTIYAVLPRRTVYFMQGECH